MGCRHSSRSCPIITKSPGHRILRKIHRIWQWDKFIVLLLLSFLWKSYNQYVAEKISIHYFSRFNLSLQEKRSQQEKICTKNFWCRNQNVISCRFGFIYKPENNLQLFHMKYKGAQAPPACAENMVFIVNNCKNRNGDVLYFFAVVLYFW